METRELWSVRAGATIPMDRARERETRQIVQIVVPAGAGPGSQFQVAY